MSLTLVTAFFDLNKYETRETHKSKENYIKWAEFLFSLDINIVFFVEKDLADHVFQRRKHFGNKDKTVVITKVFEELPWNGCNPDIDTYLKEHPIVNGTLNKDSRRYLSLTWNKLYMVEEIMINNPFDSQYFGWIDFGIYNVAANKMPPELLDDSFFIPKTNKIKVMELRCVSPIETEDVYEFTSRFRWKIAGGLWVAHNEPLTEFINHFKAQLYDLLSKRIAVHEETIFSLVYCNHKDLFDPYYGDYWDILANYNTLTYTSRVFENIELSKNIGLYDNVERICTKIISDCYDTLSSDQKFTVFDELTLNSYYVDVSKSRQYVLQWLDKLKNDNEQLEYVTVHLDRLKNNFSFYDNSEELIDKLESLL